MFIQTKDPDSNPYIYIEKLFLIKKPEIHTGKIKVSSTNGPSGSKIST